MTEGKVSEAQRRAIKKWEEKNPERKRYLRYRTTARTFVRHWANDEDLKELVGIFENENKKRGNTPPLKGIL